MITKVTHVTIPVHNYDQAIQWYTEKLGFTLTNDTPFAEGARWVTVKAPEQTDLELVLHQPFPGQDFPPVTHYVMATDDCHKEVARLKENDVLIVMEPEDQMWGIQAMFADPFGNSFLIVEEKPHQS